ncbi:MAG: hypothetical protein KJ749_05885, partial [Planctomycetes bacterium]|nr:hypothetical protein [Planctomycetota bacterium]
PPVPNRWQDEQIVAIAAELHDALAVTSCAMARDATRYAITGVLLESDSTGVRLVATDGRRLVSADLQQVDTKFQGRVIVRSGAVTKQVVPDSCSVNVTSMATAFVGNSRPPPSRIASTFPPWGRQTFVA